MMPLGYDQVERLTRIKMVEGLKNKGTLVKLSFIRDYY